MKFTPDFIADSVLDVDFQYLERIGIKAVLIDLDDTVVEHGAYAVSPAVQSFLKRQKLKLYVATNRPKSRDLRNLRRHLSASAILHPVGLWIKPFRRYYAQAGRLDGYSPEQLVMVGDRYIQDVFGANAAGIRTVVVRKLGRPRGPIDRLLSRIESRRTAKLARHYRPIEG